MKKFFAVVKREYIQRVRTKFFVVATVLGPLLTVGFTVVPALMIGLKTGGPARIAIVDQTGNMYERVASEINLDEELRQQQERDVPRHQLHRRDHRAARRRR